MFIDALLKVSAAQALAATGLSTSSIDLGAEKRQIGDGEEMTFVVSVDVAADVASGDETYEFDLVTADSADLATNLTTLSQRVIARALLVAGSKWFIPIPKALPIQRFIGLKYILGGTTPSITVTAELMPSNMAAADPKHYAKNYVV